ncbi:MAG TPA: tetratricopeptide repeat protein [Gemmataceae bacterium]|jgi:tetratricopeptide (TPR) repeat protein
MTAALALLILAAGQDRPEVAPPDPDASRQLVRDALTAYGLGVLRQRQDRLVEAVRSLEEAVRLDPEAVPPRQLLIPLYTALGRPSDAARAAAAVVIMDPSQADTWRTLARLLHEMKRTGDAVSVLNRCVAAPALADRPADRIAAYHDLARLHAALGTHPQAADACRKALDLIAANRTALLAKVAAPAALDLERAELSEMLAAASLAVRRYGDARDAALEARDGYRTAKEIDRATAVTPKLAAAYAGLGQTAKAHALLDEYLAGRPRDVEAFALKVRLLREAGEAGEALAFLGKAANDDPDFVALRVLLGDECRRLGDPRRAERAYRDAIDRAADVTAYRGLFAVLSGPGGNPAAMLDLIDTKVREARPEKDNNPAPEDDAARQRREAAAEHVRAITAALRQEPAAAGLVLTAAAGEVGRGRRRFVADRRAYTTWVLLAGVAEHAGQLGTAEELLRQALADAGRFPDAGVYGALIRVLRATRQRQALVDLCGDALKRDAAKPRPELSHGFFHFHMARALVELGKTEDALKHAEEAVKLAGTDPISTACTTKVYVLTYAERFGEAEAECQNLLRSAKAPGEVRQVRLARAHVYSTARQFEKSEEQQRLVLELDPADAVVHNSLGYELADRGRDLDEAERLIRRALELDRARKSDSLEDEGDNPAYLDSLGWVLFRRGRFAEAKALIEQAAGSSGVAADPVVWDHLGDVCARLEQPAEAAAAWAKARDLYRTERQSVNDPRGAEVERKLKRLQK